MKRSRIAMTIVVVLIALSFALSSAGADALPPAGEGIGVEVLAPTPLTPVSNIFTTLPEFSFTENPTATNYKIKVYNTNTLELVYTFTGLNCNSGVCTLSPGTALKNANFNGKNGYYSWKVKAYVSGAWLPYSTKADFTVISPGFNSTFDEDFLKWKVVYGNWSLVFSNYLKTNGIKQTVSSIVQKELTVNQLVYKVRMKRDVSDNDDSYIAFYGDVNPLDSEYDWNSYYSFDFSTDGYFSIWKRLDGSWYTIADWTYSTYVNTGDWNTLTVWLDAPDIYFWMNGNYLGYVTDTTFESGFVGIGMWRDSSIKSPLWVDYTTTYYTDEAPYKYSAGADGKVDPGTELIPSGTAVTDRQKAEH